MVALQCGDLRKLKSANAAAGVVGVDQELKRRVSLRLGQLEEKRSVERRLRNSRTLDDHVNALGYVHDGNRSDIDDELYYHALSQVRRLQPPPPPVPELPVPPTKQQLAPAVHVVATLKVAEANQYTAAWFRS